MTFGLCHMVNQVLKHRFVPLDYEAHHLLYHLHRLPLHHLHPVSYKDILSLQELPALYSFPLPMQELPLPIHSLATGLLSLLRWYMVIQVFRFRQVPHQDKVPRYFPAPDALLLHLQHSFFYIHRLLSALL